MSFAIDAPTWVWEAGTVSFGGDYPLELSLETDVLYQSPSSLHTSVSNGTPNAQLVLTVSGSTAEDMVVNLDDSGSALLVNIPVAVPAAGTYRLVAFTGRPASVGDGQIGAGFIGLPDTTDSTASAEVATANFVVQRVATTGGIVFPAITPPPNIQPSTGVRKWVFQDPSSNDAYTFEINPNQMTSPFAARNITYQATTAIDGQKLAYEGQRPATQWSFQGTLKTKDQYDAFIYWSNKPKRIWITDHFGRAWLSYITHFAPTPVRDTSSYWTHTYQMDVLIFEGPMTPQ